MNTTILLRRRPMLALTLAMLAGMLPAAVQAGEVSYLCKVKDTAGKQVEIEVGPRIRLPLIYEITAPTQADAEAQALATAKQKTATAASAHCSAEEVMHY